MEICILAFNLSGLYGLCLFTAFVYIENDLLKRPLKRPLKRHLKRTLKDTTECSFNVLNIIGQIDHIISLTSSRCRNAEYMYSLSYLQCSSGGVFSVGQAVACGVY